MSSVATPKPATEIMAVRLRPMVSAKWPNIAAPRGRPSSVAAKIEALTIAVALALNSGETK